MLKSTILSRLGAFYGTAFAQLVPLFALSRFPEWALLSQAVIGCCVLALKRSIGKDLVFVSSAVTLSFLSFEIVYANPLNLGLVYPILIALGLAIFAYTVFFVFTGRFPWKSRPL